MTSISRQRAGEIFRWVARLWSLPLIAVPFLLAAWVFIPMPFNRYLASNPAFGIFSSFYAMVLAISYVVAWHWERVGGWLALASALAFKVWFAIRWGHLGVGTLDVLLWLPAILFLLSSCQPHDVETFRRSHNSAAFRFKRPRGD